MNIIFEMKIHDYLNLKKMDSVSPVIRPTVQLFLVFV